MSPIKKQFDLSLILVLILALISLLFLSGFTNGIEPVPSTDKTVTVYAAAGTMAAMQKVAREYEDHTGTKVMLNFASSSTLARQITAGAEFDVFISANPKWMDYIQSKSLINPISRRDFLADRLALIAPSGINCSLENDSLSEILATMKGPIAIGDPAHVPCGMYTKEALTALNCWQSIENRIVPAASVRTTQQYVESGQCELGIVYFAGALQSSKVKIINVLDETFHTPIRFSMATAAVSTAGETFLHFLNQSVSMNIFTEAGYNLNQHTHLLAAQNTSIEPEYRVNTWQILSVSLKDAAACTLVVAAPGIWLGYVLVRKTFPGRSLLNACVHLPMVIPPVVTGYLALVMLGKNSVIGNWLHDTFSISIAFSWIGSVVVSAIMGLPLLVRSVKTAVEMIDRRYSLAANTLGAGPIRTFLTITIPLAAPGILAGLVLAFARCLGEFGATATFAGNIPGKTQTLSLAIYSFTQIPGAESAALRLVIISIIVSFVAMVGSEWLTQWMKHLAETAS